jgi:predicted transcriptional regulator
VPLFRYGSNDRHGEVLSLDNYGFIRQKIDIKVLILYILEKLPAPVSQNMLTELTLIDNATNYFDYIECLTELEQKDLIITTEEDKYSITPKGIRTAAEMESSLPYTIRLKASSGAERAAKILAREAMIKASHKEKPEGGVTVSLSLSDGLGEVMHLDILAGNEQQAKEMEKRFRKNAESLYLRIAGILTGESTEESQH